MDVCNICNDRNINEISIDLVKILVVFVVLSIAFTQLITEFDIITDTAIIIYITNIGDITETSSAR